MDKEGVSQEVTVLDIEELEEMIKQLHAAVESKSRMIASLTEKCNEFSNLIERSQSHSNTYKKQSEDNQQMMNGMATQINVYIEQIAKLRSEIESKQLLISKYENDLKSMQKTLEKKKRQKLNTVNEMKELKITLCSIQNKLEQVDQKHSQEIDNLKQHFQGQINTLQTDISIIKQDSYKLKADINLLKSDKFKEICSIISGDFALTLQHKIAVFDSHVRNIINDTQITNIEINDGFNLKDTTTDQTWKSLYMISKPNPTLHVDTFKDIVCKRIGIYKTQRLAYDHITPLFRQTFKSTEVEYLMLASTQDEKLEELVEREFIESFTKPYPVDIEENIHLVNLMKLLTPVAFGDQLLGYPDSKHIRELAINSLQNKK